MMQKQQNIKQSNSSVSQMQISKLIQVDIKRGLQRFNQIFNQQNELIYKPLQVMFEKFFNTIWNSFPSNVQKLYYQGLTDIFEVVFASQITTKHISLLIEAIDFDDSIPLDFKLIFDDPDRSIHYSQQIANKLYQKTKFKIEYHTQISQMVIDYINQFDPLLSMILSNVERDIQVAMLLKYTINCCLHVTDLYSVSFLLGEFYLNRSQQEQAFLIQSLLSVAARVVLPQYFDQNESDLIFQFKKCLNTAQSLKQKDNYYEIAMQILNQVLPYVLKLNTNEPALILFINDIQLNFKIYSLRK
ncbi:Conserved_hypothetical protein [Hexamita inflata]|uniref:Uncharacterized protein n=1 Tax=Hexamita inflata TaxID=28002 RepID=A0AA86U531_9EUKA|nr:Conserved hypothetical protein [Hexamita inflata]